MWCACTHHGQGVQNCDSLQPIAVFAVFNERVTAPYVVMSLGASGRLRDSEKK